LRESFRRFRRFRRSVPQLSVLRQKIRFCQFAHSSASMFASNSIIQTISRKQVTVRLIFDAEAAEGTRETGPKFQRLGNA